MIGGETLDVQQLSCGHENVYAPVSIKVSAVARIFYGQRDWLGLERLRGAAHTATHGPFRRNYVTLQFDPAQLPERGRVEIAPVATVDENRRVDVLDVIRLCPATAR